MNEQISNHSPYQKANNQGGNLTQAGRDYINTNTTNMNFLISFFIIGVLAMGGLAWAIYAGLNQNSSNTQSELQKASPNSLKSFSI